MTAATPPQLKTALGGAAYSLMGIVTAAKMNLLECRFAAPDGTDYIDEFGFHEAIVVGDVEYMNRLEPGSIGEVGHDPLLVLVFHDHHHVGPGEVFCRDRLDCVSRSAPRPNIHAVVVPVDTLAGRTAPLIPTANEQDVDLVRFHDALAGNTQIRTLVPRA